MKRKTCGIIETMFKKEFKGDRYHDFAEYSIKNSIFIGDDVMAAVAFHEESSFYEGQASIALTADECREVAWKFLELADEMDRWKKQMG